MIKQLDAARLGAELGLYSGDRGESVVLTVSMSGRVECALRAWDGAVLAIHIVPDTGSTARQIVKALEKQASKRDRAYRLRRMVLENKE